MSAAVTLVIPGRDCAGTLPACLDAALAVRDREGSRLEKIVFVDDASRDDSISIAESRGVVVMDGGGRGPANARNVGWRAAETPLVWFVDSDCVAEPRALEALLPHLDEQTVAGVSGTYTNAREDSFTACLIHEEIASRHARMSRRVDFLATFDVLYRREVLEALDGFDVRYKKAQDAEFAMRCREAGHELAFEPTSRVAHHHETRLLAYLRTQRQQGFWRVFLHLERRGHATGDSYSRLSDHLQPPVAMLCLAAAPLLVFSRLALVPLALPAVLFLLQVPMTARIVGDTRRIVFVAFAGFSFVRAFWRGVGMTLGVVSWILRRRSSAS